jgi:two-component system NtrC family sensor kinase
VTHSPPGDVAEGPRPPGALRRFGRRLAARIAALVLGREAQVDLRADRQRLSAELSRRLAELYSLQELTHVLSASLRFDTVVAEVARYAMRALDASGAIVLLAPEHGGAFEVVAAKGYLAGHLRAAVDPESGGLALDAISHERQETRSVPLGQQLTLFRGATARTAVAAPLRAHGVTVGALVVADKLVGDFTPEDARLLSTAATHAAVVLANARFFELVRSGKEQWEATFDALGEGIALVDAEARIRRANDAMGALVGEEVRGIVGRHLFHLLFGEHETLSASLRAVTAGQRPPPLTQRSDKLGRILRVGMAPLQHPSLEAAAVVVVEDITDQKRLEGQLIQSEKLAAVGTLVSGVAHELNNPLTSIAGLSEFLLEQGVGDDHAREHLRVINDQAERASRIVRNLLAFARRAPAERTTLDLGEIVQRTVLLMSYQLRQAGIAIETRIASALPPVLGDRDQIQQVVLNLLTNAAYVLAGLPEGAPRRIEVAVTAPDDRVVLHVRDTGPGLPADVAAQIFDPFFTTKPPGEGTGLGLFLSLGIAESHGGILTVESEPGHGATFTLALPRGVEPRRGRATSPPAAAAAAAPPAPSQPARSRRILIVDDDAAVRRVVTVLFTHEGHVVDGAGSGAEALDLVRRHEYDLVVADRRAAVGNEPFAQTLKRERPGWESRLIFSLSGSLPGARTAVRTLSKPFNLKDLREAAAEVWAKTP